MTLKSVLILYDFACINGGQSKVAIDSARLLADQGLDVTYLAAVGLPDPLLDYPGITVEVMGQSDILTERSRLKAMRTGIWNGAARRHLEEVVQRFDPETSVLHCHGYAKALSPSIGPVLGKGPLAAVYTMHEYFLACPNGGFYDYQRNAICTRKALGAACLTTHCDVRRVSHKAWRVARQVATWGPARLPGGLTDIIYISETQRQMMAPYLPASARLHHLPNVIPASGRPLVQAERNDVYLFVGRLTPEKGATVFAEAARQAGVRAVFIGDGQDAEAIAAINPEAKLLGWLSPDEVQDWIGRARALVFPSLWSETFGLVAFEALERGVPVICGRWNAAAEGIEDGRSGILYDAPDAASLAAAIARLGDLSLDAPPKALDAFRPEAHLAGLLELYDGMLSRRGMSG